MLTGCGHAGIVRYARALTGVEQVHAVVGGFHLTGALFEPIIGATIEALGELAPDVVMPAHCTGWRAMHAMANRTPSWCDVHHVHTTSANGNTAARMKSPNW